MTAPRACRALAFAVLMVASSAACVGPRAPSAHVPFAVRLLGASDGALLGARRDGRSVFAGSTGRDYAIEVTNDTASDIGVSITIDGLDGGTGEPVRSCEGLSGWVVPANARIAARGFWVAEARIAGYRFAPPGRSLAAITRGGRREAIGTIEACFFRVRPRSAPVTEGYRTFGGIVESEPSQDETSVVAELRDEAVGKGGNVEWGELVARIVVSYEDENGALLGTAPPPAGIARVHRDTGDEPAAEVESAPTKPPEDAKPTKPTKDPKPTKPTKPTKDPKPTK